MPSKKQEEKEPTQPKIDKAPEGLHIVELLVENIMKIRVAHLKPKGSVIQITGKNGSGKTSLLAAIAWALTGTSDIPSQPIRKGQRTGSVKMDIGDFIVTRHFTRVDPDKSPKGNTYITKLVVMGKHREQFPNPQALLNGVMGKISFDPLAFTRMDDKEQLETMRGLVTFDVDIDALDAAQKADYETRREAGREVDARKKRLDGMATPRSGLPIEPINVEEITKRLQSAANHNSTVAAKRVQKARLEEDAQRLQQQATELRQQATALLLRAAGLDGLAASVAEGQQKDGQVQELLAQAQLIVAGEEIDTAAVASELTLANELNREIAQAAAFRQVEEELRQATEVWERLDKCMKERNQQRSDAIARAKMPIEGLSIGDGEVLYQGLPFGQASNAEQIRVSMALAMASNPKLRVLRIADGSLLDNDSMELVTAEADKHGFQVWIERVDASGNVGVVMEDGEASGDEVVPEAAK